MRLTQQVLFLHVRLHRIRLSWFAILYLSLDGTPLADGLKISDKTLPRKVEHAFQACALHENRKGFDLVPMKVHPRDIASGAQTLKQVRDTLL